MAQTSVSIFPPPPLALPIVQECCTQMTMMHVLSAGIVWGARSAGGAGQRGQKGE